MTAVIILEHRKEKRWYSTSYFRGKNTLLQGVQFHEEISFRFVILWAAMIDTLLFLLFSS